MQHQPDRAPQRTALVGIGNTLAGDDGVGIYIVEQIRERLQPGSEHFFMCLKNDLFEIADYLDRASHFIFIDACLCTSAGHIVSYKETESVGLPSLHQTDIGSVMRMLGTLRLAEPFPTWEVTGVTIVPPLTLGQALSQPVREAADRLATQLCVSLGAS